MRQKPIQVYRTLDPVQLASQPGYRRDLTWRRRVSTAEPAFAAPGWDNRSAMRGAAGVIMRRGTAWDLNDTKAAFELDRRVWRQCDIDTHKTVCVPTWLTAAVAPSRFWHFLGLLVDAFRAGALGVRITYEQGAAWIGKDRSTFYRWIKKMSSAGLITTIPTYEQSPGDEPCRSGTNVYQIGPTVLAAAGDLGGACSGALAGAADGDGPAHLKYQRTTLAKKARKLARKVRRAACDRLWKRQRGDDAQTGTTPVEAVASADVTAGSPGRDPGRGLSPEDTVPRGEATGGGDGSGGPTSVAGGVAEADNLSPGARAPARSEPTADAGERDTGRDREGPPLNRGCKMQPHSNFVLGETSTLPREGRAGARAPGERLSASATPPATDVGPPDPSPPQRPRSQGPKGGRADATAWLDRLADAGSAVAAMVRDGLNTPVGTHKRRK